MIIQNIELKNWCQLEGNQSLSLGNNSNGNIVIVSGEFRSGKNAVYSAILWCLYNEIPDGCLLSGDISVCIKFKHDNNTYRLTRSCKHQKNSKGFACVDESFTVQKHISDGTWIDDTTKVLDITLSDLRYFIYREKGTYPPDDAKFIQGFLNDNNVSDELFLKNFNTIANDSLEKDWVKTRWAITYDKEHVFRITNPETGGGNLFPLLDAGERMRMILILRAALAASMKTQLPLIVDGAVGYGSSSHIDAWISIMKKHGALFSQWLLFVEPEGLKNLQERSRGDLFFNILNLF